LSRTAKKRRLVFMGRGAKSKDPPEHETLKGVRGEESGEGQLGVRVKKGGKKESWVESLRRPVGRDQKGGARHSRKIKVLE